MHLFFCESVADNLNKGNRCTQDNVLYSRMYSLYSAWKYDYCKICSANETILVLHCIIMKK